MNRHSFIDRDKDPEMVKLAETYDAENITVVLGDAEIVRRHAEAVVDQHCRMCVIGYPLDQPLPAKAMRIDKNILAERPGVLLAVGADWIGIAA
jgi:hypothetical protein